MFVLFSERDMKYHRWKMAIARSLGWTDDRDDIEGRRITFFKLFFDAGELRFSCIFQFLTFICFVMFGVLS